MAKTRKSGEIAKKTGEYEERGPRGGKLPEIKKVTIDDTSDRLPPTQKRDEPTSELGRLKIIIILF
ncbi:MAG: hypothetical protein NTY37_05640 [Methanothrix sp.]|nr:hypothetical protein [Methanothrix sp.]